MKSRAMGSADDLDDNWWAPPTEDADPNVPAEAAATATKPRKDSTPQDSQQKALKKRKHEVLEDEVEKEKSAASGGKSKKSKKADKSNKTDELAKASPAKTVVSAQPIMTRAEVTEEITTRLSSCGRQAVDEDDVTMPEEQALVPQMEEGDELSFSSYLHTAIPKWSKEISKLKHRKHGRPVLLVISSSAVRSVDLIRAAGDFASGSQVAKLFAKHFKLEQHKEFLSQTVVHVGIGTPNRILKLVESGHLSLKRLKYVVIDWTLVDAKQRQIFQIPEVTQDLVRLVLAVIMPRVQTGETQIGLF